MSRARHIGPDCLKPCANPEHWFDMDKNHLKATDKQIELLATVEGLDIDELLESGVTQGDLIRRAQEALHGQPIPVSILEKRQKWRRHRQKQPPCRLCGKVGDSTKHHFVNKWILKELSGYQSKWADRRANCIPVCIDCHRDLHDRSNGPVSIAHKLTNGEKAFASAALEALAEERPKLLILIARGDDSVYEARLVKDWIAGEFEIATEVEEPLAQVA